MTTALKFVEGLTRARQLEVLNDMALTEVQKNLARSTIEAATASNTASISANGLSAVIKGLWATISAHPIAAVVTAMTVLVTVLHGAAEKAREARQAIIDNGKSISKSAAESRDAYNDLQKVNEAYTIGAKTKEELIDATDSFLKSIGLERWEIQGLSDDYSNLISVMSKYKAAKVAEDREGLINAVRAAESNLYSYGRDIDPSLYAQRAGKAVSDKQQKFASLLFDHLSKNGFDTEIDDSGFFKVNLTGGTSSASDIIEMWESAKKLKEEMLEFATENGSLESLFDSQFWKYNESILDSIGDYASSLKSAYNDLNENIAETAYLTNGTIPTTVDEYYKLRDVLIEATSSSESFKKSGESAADAVDKVLSSFSFSKQFASEINEFKHALKDSDLDKELVDFFNSLVASKTDIDLASLIEPKFSANSGLQEWADKYGYTVDDIISHVQALRKEINKPAEDAEQAAVKTNKEYEKFKKNIKSLRIDIVKTLGEGKQLSEEQNEVFLKWRDSLGYTKDQLEEVYKLFQMMYKETPPETITATTVGNRVRAAREAFEQERALLMEAEKKYGAVYFDQTQFGNIDMDNRQPLEWTEENLEKYKDAIQSYSKLSADDLANTVSAVLGDWDKFSTASGTLPIAFSPMLQTESGEPELLTNETIHKYVDTLIKKADEEAQKTGEDRNKILFKLDAEGIEVDGKKIRGIIAGVGDEAERVAAIMRFVGESGSIQLAAQNLADEYSGAVAFGHNHILDDIGNLLTLQDEIKKAGIAWEEYQQIVAGGDPEDLASNMSDALEKAIKDIELGRIDAPSVWGAAKLLFSDDKLANELGYDLNKIAAELNSGFIKTLFGKPENEDEVADYAARISNYLIENANKMKSVDLVSDKTSGGFKFMYSSLKELANDMGLTEEATTALLKALDAYGVEMMHSSEETRQYIKDYQSLRESGLDAATALNSLVTEMAKQDVWEPHALQALQELRDAGVISGDDSEFIEMIKEVYQKVEEADRKEAHPEVFLDGVQTVEQQARTLWDTLKAIFETETLKATVVLDDQTGTDVEGHASGTRNAPGGVALVNELGPELISDNGNAYIANGGKPGFTVLNRGAIVFTAEETKEIFRKGYSNVPVSAYAEGTPNRASLRDRLISGMRTPARAQVEGTDAVGSGSSNYKICPNCGAMCSIGTSVCGQCGYNFSTGKMENDYYVPYTPDPSSQPSQPSSGYYYHNCANCGREISSADNPCPYCGKDPWSAETTPVDSGYYYHNCANCGKSISSRDTVCPYCGKDPWNTAPTVNPYNTLVPGSPNKSNTKPGGSSGYTGSGGGSSVGSADYSSQADPEKVDWIAVLLNRIQRKVADLEKIASSGFKSLETRLKAGNDEINELGKEISAERQAYERYLAEANGVGLSDDLAQKVQEGTIDINEYDQETRELIDKYSEW